MAFESGSVSFTVFYLSRDLPENVWNRFARHALPSMDALGAAPVQGWVTGRHLLDRHITSDSARLAGRLRLTLVKAERKIPQPLLRAECMMEELAALAASGRAKLNRAERAEIKRSVMERLLPAMPPTLSGIPVVYTFGSGQVYAGVTSDKQVDALTLAFREATGETLIPMTPEHAALRSRRIDIRELPPADFSPSREGVAADGEIGRDFLTWLWFFQDTEGGSLSTPNASYAMMIEGPLTFYKEGHGAHLALLQKGQPLVSSEAKAALQGGKKLRRAVLRMACGEETWSVTVDADAFAFRGLKLPRAEAFDPVARFEERMLSLERFRAAFLAYYDRFLGERSNPQRWPGAVEDIRRWIVSRAALA